MTTHIVRYVNLCHLFIYIQQWKKCETLHIQSSLGIYAHKYLRKCKDTYFSLQNNIVLEQRCLVMIAPYLDTLLIPTIF